MKKLIIAVVITFNVTTQMFATTAQCEQSIDIFINHIDEHKYVVEQKLTSRITLTARNVVSSYEMARSYCRNESYYTEKLLVFSDMIQKFKSALNIN